MVFIKYDVAVNLFVFYGILSRPSAVQISCPNKHLETGRETRLFQKVNCALRIRQKSLLTKFIRKTDIPRKEESVNMVAEHEISQHPPWTAVSPFLLQSLRD